MSPGGTLGWFGIARLGLVQAFLGSIVILTTSTLNRVMVVELALPALLPGFLVGVYYAVQLARPRWGHCTDTSRRRTPWIIGGMAILAVGGLLSSVATAWMATEIVAGVALAIVAFILVGAGVGACGTSLLVLLATHVSDRRRAAAATVVWMTMIVGFIVTAAVAGKYLDPFSMDRLVLVTATVCGLAFVLTIPALWRLERLDAPSGPERDPVRDPATTTSFRDALRQVWQEKQARRFTCFVFVSMLAYSAQDLVLEPFAGAIFGMTPGETTQLAGLQYSGVLAGMILVAIAGSVFRNHRFTSMRVWTVGGCIFSALALAALAIAGFVGPAWPVRATVVVLGVANGAFAVAAIGAMMGLARQGAAGREGVRMGMWGAAQAVAFGLGALAGTFVVDVMRILVESKMLAYAAVFACEAVMFLAAARLAQNVYGERREDQSAATAIGDGLLAEAVSAEPQR